MITIIEDSRQQEGKHELKRAYFMQKNIEVVRSKLPFGDYALPPSVAIDTKANMDEIAANICGKAHKRFIRECKAAKEAGCQLIILVENTVGVTELSQVHTWINPRIIYSPGCVKGDRLQKAMETISERYGVQFMFCTPEDSGAMIEEILKHYEHVGGGD